LPVGKKDKNIIGDKLILGVSVFPAYRAGVFPAYGRQASSVPISKKNKATAAIADIHIELFTKSFFKKNTQLLFSKILFQAYVYLHRTPCHNINSEKYSPSA